MSVNAGSVCRYIREGEQKMMMMLMHVERKCKERLSNSTRSNFALSV